MSKPEPQTVRVKPVDEAEKSTTKSKTEKVKNNG